MYCRCRCDRPLSYITSSGQGRPSTRTRTTLRQLCGPCNRNCGRMSVRRIVYVPACVCRHVASSVPARRCAASAQSRTQQESSWGGLSEWRSFVDTRRGLGPKGITDAISPEWESSVEDAVLPGTLAEQAVLALNTADPCVKAAVTHRMFTKLHRSQDLVIGQASAPDCALLPPSCCPFYGWMQELLCYSTHCP